MTAPRYLTEPAPVAAVPVDKIYLWIMMLEYLKGIYADKVAEWSRFGVAPGDMFSKDLEDMLMFLRMSYSDYTDWLGMSSPFIEYHKPQVGDA